MHVFHVVVAPRAAFGLASRLTLVVPIYATGVQNGGALGAFLKIDVTHPLL